MACPICKKPTETAFHPFCSERCANVDLAKWFTDGYTIPATEAENTANLEDELHRADENKHL